MSDVFEHDIADLVVTSPPYNIGKSYTNHRSDDEKMYSDYLQFSRKWLENCYYWTRSTGRLCMNIPLDTNYNGKRPVCADITSIALKVGWKYHATVIWNEGNISRRTAWGSFKSASAPHIIAPVEVIVVMYKDQWKRERQGTSDITADEFKNWVWGIWSFNGESAKRIGHEAPFPRELPHRCIKLLSFPGDTILDPFIGSGTTMIEALLLNREIKGIELERKYCLLSINRTRTECGAILTKSEKESATKSASTYWTLDKEIWEAPKLCNQKNLNLCV